MRPVRIISTVVAVVFAAVGIARAESIGFVQTNLVSNKAGLAAHTDPDLKNPWGISFGATSPFWVADNGTGKSTLYTGAGVKQNLVVTIPPAPGSPDGTVGTPTGTAFNGAPANFTGDRFLFATEDGVIAGWKGALGTTAEVRADNSAFGAIYKGLAIEGGQAFAANFGNGTIDVFSGVDYSAVTPLGGFLDPNLPAGYSPFNIQNLGGELYVTFASRTGNSDDETAGPGLGVVDVFDTNGVLQRRLVSAGGALNAPWGLALAPAGFGPFGGALLVGNFGDGRINAYDPVTGMFLGTLTDPNGSPIAIDGLWALAFGNGGTDFSPNRLYFTAGLNDEEDGLFGSLRPAPEPGTLLLAAVGFSWGLLRRRGGAAS